MILTLDFIFGNKDENKKTLVFNKLKNRIYILFMI